MCERHHVPSRRAFLARGASAAALAALAPWPAALARESALDGTPPHSEPVPQTPDEAIVALRAGNARFVAGAPTAPHRDKQRVAAVATKQAPFAAFLGCADSRVPIEITFDQGFGDLFVNRVAGNIVTPEMIASLEFGCQVLGCKALVVLGHSNCGAVSAAMQRGAVPGMISSLYHRIRPAIADLPQLTIADAVTANVRHQVEVLSEGSVVLADLVKSEQLRIVGAVYDLGTGIVAWV